MNPRRPASRSVLAACGALVALLLGAAACGDTEPGADSGPSAHATMPAHPPARQMLLELDEVVLLEGFGDFERLEPWHDYPGENTDREALVLHVPRNSRLRWELGSTAQGALEFDIARFTLGVEAEAGGGELTAIAMDGDQPAMTTSYTLVMDPLEADAEANPQVWREGDSSPIKVIIPPRTTAIELRFTTDEPPMPGGAWWGLLSPRLVTEPATMSLTEGSVPAPVRSSSLLAGVTLPASDPVPLSTWRCADESDRLARTEAKLPLEGAVAVAPATVEGRFQGRKPRHALALTGGASVSWPARRLSGLRLRGAVALDERMPEGCAGAFVLRAGDEVLATISVSSTNWQAVDLELGLGRTPVELSLALEVSTPPSGTRRVVAPNFVLRTFENHDHVATTLRAGFADLRVEADGEVSRSVATEEQPSVLLIHVETLRADVIGDAEVAPNLVRLAAAGVSYPRAVAPSPWTLPSTATLFTGLSPTSHGVTDHDSGVISAEAKTLAERLLDAGWITAGVVTNTLLNAHAGWSRGFLDYLEVPEANMRQVGALARDWVGGQGESRWFLFLHPFDPHGPHNAPAEFRERFVEPELLGRDFGADEAATIGRLVGGERVAPESPEMRFFKQRYDGDVAYFDRELGRLLSALDEQGALDTTLVVLTADHGEEFGEFGFWGHGTNLHDPAVRVPLVLVRPGALSGWARGEERGEGQVVERLVSTDGLHATLLGLLGVESSGADLRPALGQAESEVWIETNKGAALDVPGDPQRRPIRGVRSETHLLLRCFRLSCEDKAAFDGGDFRDELWALGETPADARRLPNEGDAYLGLSSVLRQHLERAASEALVAPGSGADAGTMRDLQQLGYLHGTGSVDDEDC